MDFKRSIQEKVLDNSIQKEFEGEIDSYTVNKRIINLISDMGYVIKESKANIGGVRGSKRSSLVKQTQSHLIMVNFDYRRRIALTPENLRDKMMKEDPELLKKFEPESFSSFLRKYGLLPPEFDQPEFEEENIIKEYDAANSNPIDKTADH